MELKTQLQKPALTAACTALAVGLFTHFFGLVTILHNYDDIAQQPTGYGTGVTSGRWFLSLLGDFWETIEGNYNLPFLNGVLFLVLIAVSAGFLVSLFSIRSPILAALTGAVFSVFPAAFSTLAFRYTAAYYGIAILLSILAAWVLPKKWGLLLSSLCTACSLGIYQAYVPITIGIFVLLLLQQSLDGQACFRKLVFRGLFYCFALLLGLLLYFLLMKLTLLLYGTQLSDYQGVNEMGKLSLQTLPSLIKEAVYSFVMLPLKDYCGIASMMPLKVIYILLAVFCGIALVCLWLKYIRNPLMILFGLCMCLVFPVAVNFIVIMCPDSWIYTLMVYSFVLLPIVPIILAERLTAFTGHRPQIRWIQKALTVILSILICCYSYQTNVNYTALYYSNRQVENYLNSLIVQVRMAEGFDPSMEWAFIGEIQDPLLLSYWQYEMNYGGIEQTQWMLQRYSWPEWIRNYYGYSIPMSDEATVLALSNTDVVSAMPCWPADGSIQIIDNTVVIKFQEIP